jgi:hypothetical protein
MKKIPIEIKRTRWSRLDILLNNPYIYIHQPGFPDQKGKPGCLVKGKYKPKTDRSVCFI